MARIVDWNQVKRRIEEQTWARELYTDMVRDLDEWIEVYHDDPERRAGWGHDYNCSRCSARLQLDLKQPHTHLCPACGHANTGVKLDEAWNNMYRGRANAHVMSAAIAHCIEPHERYPRYMRKVLDLYADNYDRFDNEAVAKRFEGKIMNQHLDDAVGMMSIMMGMNMVLEEFDQTELDRYYRDLFAREAELFDFFATRIYNIPVWIKCAEAMIGVLFAREELITRAFYGKYGVLDQLERGVTADGMWYEGSTHYHFYSLQPLSYLLLTCQQRDFHLPELQQIRDTVEQMFVYPLRIMFRNRTFPNPNDAHPLLTLDRYAMHYEYASALFDNPLFREVCGTLHRQEEAKGSVSRLLFNGWERRDAVPKFGSVNNADAFTATVRSANAEVFIKYGIHTQLHMHPDVMNIEVAFDGDVVAADLGSGGYASFLFVEWQRLTPAHNTIAIDQQNQRALPSGIVEEFNPEENLLRVKAKGVYDAANYTREIRVGDAQIADRFLVDARGDYTLDWFFYCLGEVRCEYETTPVESLGEENGYQHLFDIRRFDTDDDWHVDFELEDKTIRVSMAGVPGTVVHIVNSYMDSTEHTRYGLMVRRQAEKTLYDTMYTRLLKS